MIARANPSVISSLTDVSGCSSAAAKTAGDKQAVIQEVLIDQGLRVYPNPTTGVITIALPSVIASGSNYSIKLYDITGRLLFSETNENVNQKVLLDLNAKNSLSNGTYILEVSSASFSEKKRIVIEN